MFDPSQRRQHAELGRLRAAPPLEHGFAGADVVAGATDVCDPPDAARADLDVAARCRLASSSGTTASAPAGSIAPVEIAIACPGASARLARGRPRATRRPRSSSTGRSCPPRRATSSARTAKPSIAELSNGGTGCSALTSSPSTLPSAASERDALAPTASRRRGPHAAPRRSRSAASRAVASPL